MAQLLDLSKSANTGNGIQYKHFSVKRQVSVMSIKLRDRIALKR